MTNLNELSLYIMLWTCLSIDFQFHFIFLPKLDVNIQVFATEGIFTAHIHTDGRADVAKPIQNLMLIIHMQYICCFLGVAYVSENVDTPRWWWS